MIGKRTSDENQSWTRDNAYFAGPGEASENIALQTEQPVVERQRASPIARCASGSEIGTKAVQRWR
jgi:hypothetical protein